MTAKRTDLEREALSRLTASTAAWMLSMSDSGFRQAKPPRGQNGYDARELVKWHIGRLKTPDPLMDVPSADSPALERYRTAKARLAELTYEQACRTVLPVAEVRSAVVGMTMPLRRAAEELGRTFGPDAQRVLNSAIATYAEAVRRQFTQAGGENDDHDQS